MGTINKKNILEIFSRYSVWVLPVVILVSDFIVRDEILPTFKPLQWAFYFLSFVYSVILYSAAIILLRILYKRRSKLAFNIVFFLILSFYTGTLLGSYGYYAYTGIMPNFFVFSFIFHEPLNSWTIVQGGFTKSSLIFGLLSFIVLGASLWFTATKEPLRYKFQVPVRIAVVVLFLTISGFLHNNTRFNDQVYVSDTNTIAFVWRNLYNHLTGDSLGSAGLQSRNKPRLTQIVSNPGFNVLFVVTESLRKGSLGVYGYERNTTPFMSKFAQTADRNRYFLFKKAYSNSSSTLLSFPSLLTGVSPAQPVPMTHTYPLFWEYGKSAGLSTFYITSHNLQWNNFEGFFKNSGIDFLWDKERSGLNVFNDIGIDDRETVKEFKRHLSGLKTSDKRFAGVLHLNTNHFPYIVPEESKFFAVDSVPDQYDNSVRHLDSLLEDVYTYLKKEGFLENTVVIFTSDHGESLFEHDYLGHIDSNYVETVSIPMLLYIPDSLKESVNLQAIRRNTEKPVANTDLIPTFIDILNLENNPAIKRYSANLEGRSLLRDIYGDRRIIITNNNEISLYKVGISYIKGNYHYIMNLNSNPSKERLFDLSKDPKELKDLWVEASEENKIHFREVVKDCGVCVELFISQDLPYQTSEADLETAELKRNSPKPATF
ncbi:MULTISPECIES: phosphoethanolamine transferase [unclassified Leptospira]|uniref:phosphoethanolamine transferase n=1 Tax=unclassified Leptospira TaxID=2633828 RepID=UPI0002BE257B|nr:MULTISPECIES: sulfatase-like hydrolase/transferase [unclassified Leptospira]EMK00333.1 arylsulfatase [Leptospira sp. B5-022]MCR1792256.1 sulfatase-like hydrolase/transferase [Leptospira sp. id769339]